MPCHVVYPRPDFMKNSPDVLSIMATSLVPSPAFFLIVRKRLAETARSKKKSSNLKRTKETKKRKRIKYCEESEMVFTEMPPLALRPSSLSST